jgi:hypothetical protein
MNDLYTLFEQTSKKFWDSGFSNLSEQEKVVICIWELESQVGNGGFKQFFWQATVEASLNCIWALKLIDAHKIFEIVSEAYSAFPKDFPMEDLDERQEFIDEHEDKLETIWERLDNIFWNSEEKLNQLVKDYLIKKDKS